MQWGPIQKNIVVEKHKPELQVCINYQCFVKMLYLHLVSIFFFPSYFKFEHLYSIVSSRQDKISRVSVVNWRPLSSLHN